jgi:ribose transport system substrate-binding protein
MDMAEIKIGFSESSAGNSWRQAMLKEVRRMAEQAIKAGLIAELSIRVSADQIPDIEYFIENTYHAIVINPASTTRLNKVIRKATDAGIKVVVFDQAVTEDSVYTVGVEWAAYGAVQGNYVGGYLKGRGNILEVRGQKGSSADVDISAATHAALARFPALKIVGSVHGNWTQTIAEQAVAEVLPDLPQIDAVVTQGGDGYGTARAFINSDRPLPVIIMGHRQVELKWWKEQRDKHNYKTISASATPGIGAVAAWVARELVVGKDVPRFVEMPLLVIEEKDLDAWLNATEEGGVATGHYSLEWTRRLIESSLKHTPLPTIEVPERP